MEITSLVEVQSVCRICLDCPENPISVWDNFEMDSNYNVADIIMECTSVHIEKNTETSEILCKDCLSVLTSLYTFRQRCIKTNSYLEDLVENIKNLAQFEQIEILDDIKEEPIIPEYLEDSIIEPDVFETCDICNIKIPSKMTKEDHFYEHVAVAKYLDYQCDVICCYACKEVGFIDIVDLEMHLDSHSSFSCRMCDAPFMNLKALQSHWSEHGLHSTVCFECLISYQPTLKNKHKHRSLVHKTSFQCALCNSVFTNCSDLKTHIKIHTKSIFSCKNCDQSFADIFQLLKHQKTHNFSKLCPTCGTRYATKHQLEQHVNSKHTTVKIRPICPICNKVYFSDNSLKVHMMRHENIKPFSCSFEGCDYQTLQNIDLRKHERVHTGHRPYKCTFTGCSRAFKTSSHRKVHLRRHLGEKRHECTVCHMRFTETTQLKTHSLIHTNSRPYSCDVCGKNFRRRYYVKRHQELVHHMQAKNIVKSE